MCKHMCISCLVDLPLICPPRVAIYFDGYLPSAKEPERKKRFIDMSKGLRTYFSLYPVGVPRTGSSSTKQAGASKKLPTPPFLVPAVVEALCASETYAPITKLVPGEADIFCAQHVCSSGGMIITSDSDLLAHDLGHDGSVTFFPGVTIRNHAGVYATNVPEYSALRICERLFIPQERGLSSVAFQVSLDPQVSLQRAIQLAKEQANSETTASEHTRFIGQYLSPEIMENVSLEPMSGHVLDPRVSELVLKLLLSNGPALTGVTENGTSQDNVDVPMYLPFLADSPARTSAWEISTPLRGLAYGIGRLLTTRSISSVVEYRRLQTLPGGTRIELPPESGIDELCTELVDSMAKIRACVAEPELRRTILTIHHDILWSRAQGKGSILSLDMLQAEANGTLDVGSWDFVHLHAQVQGTYYSLRMIQQVYDFVSRDHLLPDSISQLRRDVGRLSLITDFPSISDFAVLFGKIRAGVELPALVESLRLGEDVAAKVQSILHPKDKKRKRSKRSGGQQDSPINARRPSNNPFGLLGDGG
jgi:hypothetical protein